MDLEFSNTLINQGTSSAALPNAALFYTNDRQDFANCAATFERSKVLISNASDLQFNGKVPFSISVWFRIKNNGSSQQLISTSGYSLTIGQGCLAIAELNLFGCYIDDYYNSGDMLTKWYHLVISASGDSSALYVDNKLVKKGLRNRIMSTSDTVSLFHNFSGVIDNFKV